MYEEDSTLTNQRAHNDLMHWPTKAPTSDIRDQHVRRTASFAAQRAQAASHTQS